VTDRSAQTNCSHAAAALNLFLVTVGDAKGMGYYGDKSIINYLSMIQNTLSDARASLVRIGLIAWQNLFQECDTGGWLKQAIESRDSLA